jgi:DNA (cytosine-5)-methyltransferase 1
MEREQARQISYDSRMDRPFTFYEFFAGGGMARLGLGEGWVCKFANDFAPVKARTYRANFGDAADHFHEGDVWKVTVEQLPDHVDLAWASSPCQDFSLAGARAGLKGGRSSAFFGFWRLVEALAAEGRAPRTIVIENVVGLLSSHEGADFRALCWALAKEGYVFGALEIDAARFLPQSRPRVFVVATQNDDVTALTQIEPRAPFHSQRVVAAYEKLGVDLQARWRWWSLQYPPARNQSLAAFLEDDASVTWFDDEKKDRLVSLLNRTHNKKLESAKARKERVVGTLFRRMRVENKTKVQRAELRFDGYAGCLRTPGGGSSGQIVVVVNGKKVQARRLLPIEAARLMGLGADYNLPPRNTAALEVLGDGVVVPVVAFLRENLLDPLAKLSKDLGNAEEAQREVANSR